MPVKIFSFDETRPGLITSPGKRITLSGVSDSGNFFPDPAEMKNYAADILK